MPLPAQTRLVGSGQEARRRPALPHREGRRPALARLARLAARRGRAGAATSGDRFRCEARVLKDKRRGPGWTHGRSVVDRMACVDLPAFPLQLLLRRHPDWRDHPVAVVDSDKPQGTILWVNERARALPHPARACATPRRSPWPGTCAPPRCRANEIDHAVAALGRRLRRFTPARRAGRRTSPASSGSTPRGSSGSTGRCTTGPVWSAPSSKRLGFRATVVVGFSRFGTYALARAKRGVIVLRDARRRARGGAARAARPARARARRCGTTLGQAGRPRPWARSSTCPPRASSERFGPEVLRLHRLASGELRLPLQPEQPAPPAMQRLALDHPETDVHAAAGRHRAADAAAARDAGRARRQALAEIRVGFRFERLGDHLETRPARGAHARRRASCSS